MDKAKEAALKGKAQAQQLAQQGQAKVAEMKETREEGELYKTLGEAYFNEQRKGGAHEAVEAALAALDTHFANLAADPAPAAPPAADAPPASGRSGEAPSGDFTIDDV